MCCSCALPDRLKKGGSTHSPFSQRAAEEEILLLKNFPGRLPGKASRWSE